MEASPTGAGTISTALPHSFFQFGPVSAAVDTMRYSHACGSRMRSLDTRPILAAPNRPQGVPSAYTYLPSGLSGTTVAVRASMLKFELWPPNGIAHSCQILPRSVEYIHFEQLHSQTPPLGANPR